jgi:hypothetical protein
LPRRPAPLFAAALLAALVASTRRSQMSTAQTTTNKATLRRFQRAVNIGDGETISKTIGQTEGGNR